MTIDSDKILHDLLNSLDSLEGIRPEEIPNIALYMDQVTTFMDAQLASSRRFESDKVLTKTMINNYAKNKLLPPPVKKKYSPEHMMLLVFIYYFKNILSITDIQTLLAPITDRYFGTESGFSIKDIYDEIFQMEKEEIASVKEDLLKKADVSKSMFGSSPEEDREFLQLFSFICLLSFDVYLKKQMIEHMVDELASLADTADFKVGAIYINGQNDTAGYTFQHHSGITKAMENLGLDPASQLLIVDNVAEDYTAVSNAIDTLAGQGANIIFGISFGYIDAMNDKAEEYPEIIFSHATGYMGNDTNFNNYFGRIYQARYLTGVAAGLKSLEMGNNSIGYVAAYNREYAETCSGINAFALGVQAVNPDAVVHVNKISTWGDENLERQAAQALIDTYDCCVIGQHCDSAQPQLVAAENNVFGCGYNSDMTEQAPNAHLTAAIWHWDVYYQAAIETAMTCGGAENFVTEMGGNAYYAGLSEGFVDASTLNELVAAPGTAAAMEAVRELIDSGEWDVFSGVKLNITVDAEADTAAVEQVDAPLMSDGYELKDGEVVEMANPEIVPAGGASVTDDVIKSGMNYNVAGVVEG